jgi:Uncharacterized protein conserved in bacteria
MDGFRGLYADEIEIRVKTITAKGASLFLYKTARCDMNLLDETYGIDGWQRDHKEVKGNMYAGVAIWSESLSQWIWKWDCGTENFAEKEKSEASDSFKRACTNLGIGRELYTQPQIFIQCETELDGKKYKLKNPYFFNGCKVTDIHYSEFNGKREFLGFKIRNKNDEIIWEMFLPRPLGEPQIAWVKSIADELEIEYEKVLETYGVDSFAEMDTAMMAGFIRKAEVTRKTKKKARKNEQAE